jgi:hypothetical protein
MDRRSFLRTAGAVAALGTGLLATPASLVRAQAVTRSIYVMPYVADQSGRRYPKYFRTLFPTLSCSVFRYGNEAWCLVGILDVPPATDTALLANADVFELPANLDQTMGSVGVRNTVRNRLEAVNIPGTWIQTITTYREVVRFIGACCQFAQRFQGIMGDSTAWFAGGVTLDSPFSSLSANARQGMLDTAASFGFDSSGFTAAALMRTIVKSAGDQYVAAGLPLELEGPL